MFQLTEFTEATLCSVTNRVEKHGDEDVPAVTLAVEITAANTLLDTITPDGSLRQALYKSKSDDEPELPGVEASTPVLRTHCIDSVALTTAHEGWTLEVDDGIDKTTPMTFDCVKVDKLKIIDAKQGGSIVLKVRLGTSDVDADKLGKLGMHNGQSIWITLRAPEKQPEAIDGTTGHPGAAAAEPDATDLFAVPIGAAVPIEGPPDQEQEDDEGSTPDREDQLDAALTDADAEQAAAEARANEGWPFPKPGADASGFPPADEGPEADDAAAFEAGAVAAIAERSKPSRRGRKTATVVE